MGQTGQEVNFNASPDKQSPNLNPVLQLKQILMYYMNDFEDFGNDKINHLREHIYNILGKSYMHQAHEIPSQYYSSLLTF